MKISCQACAAKYTIADEKVLGKIVKIRCKKCGATIVVNGNDPSANAGGGAAEPARAYDYVAQGAHGDTWTVNVADGDQRTLTDGEIADAYHSGVVDDETFCWKDGMTDWLPIREIEQLHAACTATRATSAHPSTMPPDGVTKIQQTGPGLFGASPSPAAAYAAPRPMAGQAGNGAMMSPNPTAAARRAGGRAPAADLFGGAAQAGSEEDVMTSAPVGMPEAHEDPAKLTGQRNENSVLFSLNALTSPGPTGPGGRPMPATSEASGLIDIRQLGAQIGIGDDKKRSRIDDIMNLAGGGAFSPSLSAPVMSAPSMEEYAPVPEANATGQLPAAGKSKALIFGAIGAGVVVICGAIGIAAMVMGKSDKPDGDKTAGSSATATGTAPTTSAGMTEPTATASDTGTAAVAPPPTDTAASPSATTAKTAATTATTATTKPTTTTTATAAPTATTTTTATATATAAAGGGSDQPFNMGEAKARLAGIAGSVQGCKKGDLSGAGRVVVTFAPGGNVASAVVSGPPFAGTPTGACISSRFRGAHVPAFAGSPFSVSKSFTIN